MTFLLPSTRSIARRTHSPRCVNHHKVIICTRTTLLPLQTLDSLNCYVIRTLPKEPGFYVSLSVSGSTVPLYDIQSTEEKTICYVESREGASFAVNFGDERVKRKKGYQASVLIDGQWSVSILSMYLALRLA